MPASPRTTRQRCPAGFTLAEVLLASAILAFAVASLSQALIAGQVHAHEGLRDARATSLLEATMAEIARLPYADPQDGDDYEPGPEAGEVARTGFDNLDDYHGWFQTAGNLTDFAGNAYPDSYAGYARSVEVTEADDYVEIFNDDFDGLLVVVTVTHELGRSWTLERYFAEPED